MKKTLAFMAAAAMLLATVSCTKEGVFNPKEKIAKISQSTVNVRTESYAGQTTTTTDSTAKHVMQEWKWDGNLLTTITKYYYYETLGNPTTGVSSVMTLTYDGKQLAKVSDADGQNYATYTYDGSKLTKIESYDEGKLKSSVEITHDGKKIAKAVVTIYDEEPIDDVTKFALSTVMPTQKVLEKVLANRAAKDAAAETQTIDFTFDGGNATKIVMTYGQGYTATMEYTFDKKKNPFNGFYASIGDGGFNALNENNVLTETETYSRTIDGHTETYSTSQSYTYEYDGKFPTSVSYTNTDENGLYTTTSTHTTYYEYAE